MAGSVFGGLFRRSGLRQVKNTVLEERIIPGEALESRNDQWDLEQIQPIQKGKNTNFD